MRRVVAFVGEFVCCFLALATSFTGAIPSYTPIPLGWCYAVFAVLSILFAIYMHDPE